MSEAMPYEVELKYRIGELAALRSSLESMGATFDEEVEQFDRYFNHPARDFAETDEAVRIRSIGDANFLTYKGPLIDTLSKTRQELEIGFESGEQRREDLSEVLTQLNFREVATVQKIRTPGRMEWERRTVELCLDRVDGVGEFVELEMIAKSEDREAVRDSLLRLAERLDLREPIRTSYLQMLLRWRDGR